MNSKTYIYTLADPITGLVRYVGKANNIADRYKTHFRKEKTKKSHWIQSLVKNGLKPVIEELDCVDESDWSFWEQYWIQFFVGNGFNLTNGDSGGIGRGRSSNELNKKISKSLKGRKFYDRSKPVAAYDRNGKFVFSTQSISDAAEYIGSTTGGICKAIKTSGLCCGYMFVLSRNVFPNEIPPFLPKRQTYSEERRLLLSQRQIGKTVSKETREKQSKARLGKSPANKGIPMKSSLKTKARLSSTCSKQVFTVGLNGFVVAEWCSFKFASEQLKATRAGLSKTSKGTAKHTNSQVCFV